TVVNRHVLPYFSSITRPHPRSSLFPYTTLFRSNRVRHMDYGVQINKLMYTRLLKGEDITLFSPSDVPGLYDGRAEQGDIFTFQRSEEHTSELQSRFDLVCRLLLEKKKTKDRR